MRSPIYIYSDAVLRIKVLIISGGVTLSCGKNFNARFFYPPRAIKKLVAATTSREKIAVDNLFLFFFFESVIIRRSFLRAARYHDRYRGRDTRIRRF